MFFYMSEKKRNKLVCKTMQHRGDLLKLNMLRRKEQQKKRNDKDKTA